MRAGSTNTGIATGTPELGPTVSSMSTLTVAATQTPSIGLVKSARRRQLSGTGCPGHLQLPGHQHRQRQPHLGRGQRPHGAACRRSAAPTPPWPRGPETCTATYTTTQADVDAGSITNTGTATGTPRPADEADVTATSSADRPRHQDPVDRHREVGHGRRVLGPGHPDHLQLPVTNTGNVTLTSVGVTDPMVGLSRGQLPHATLAPGPRRPAPPPTPPPRPTWTPGRSPTPARPPAPRRRAHGSTTSSADRPGAPRPRRIGLREDGRRSPGSRPRAPDHLQLQGHQHRQRHPHLGRGHRPHGRVCRRSAAPTPPWPRGPRRPAPPPTPPPRPTWTPDRSPTPARPPGPRRAGPT